MKKWLLQFIVMVLSISAIAQVDSTTPPYKKFPTVPPFQILLGDSTTTFSKANLPKKKPVLLMLFSPDCNHCQHETEELVAHKEDLKKIQIVMVTMHPLSQMKDFINKYRLNEVKNIVVGKDTYYTLISFYGVHFLPFNALYDKKGNLISAVEGTTSVSKLLETFK